MIPTSAWALSRRKRTFDIVVGGVLALGLLPLMGVVAALVLISSGRPVLFTQPRAGRNGKEFTVYKFRTMRSAAPGEGWEADEARITGVGRFLRRTSLDELPELMAVVMGRMSLVGPRPLLVDYLPQYSPRHGRRHEVRPGLTGLAQVSGRRTLKFGDRLELDVVYVESATFGGDLAILTRTLGEPFRRNSEDVYSLEDVDDVGLRW